MAITATQVSVPAASGSVDNAAIALNISPVFLDSGVTGVARLVVQKYRANSDGSNPVRVGNAETINIADIYKSAAGDGALAAALTAITEALQTYITAKGL